MNPMQAMVQQFHHAFGVNVGREPHMPTKDRQELRENLIREEFEEFVAANKAGDLVGAADALSDLLYVVFGAGVEYGIDLQPCFEEVHRSNMSKMWKKGDGNPSAVNPEVRSVSYACVPGFDDCAVCTRADGKIIKSPSYSPADLAGVLAKQASETHTCPLRMNDFGPWERKEGLDRWDRVGPDLVCNFCGSMHPQQFLQICRAILLEGPTTQPAIIYLNDHCDKIYVRRKGIPNASHGAIKFKCAHLDDLKNPIVLEALKRSEEFNPVG